MAWYCVYDSAALPKRSSTIREDVSASTFNASRNAGQRGLRRGRRQACGSSAVPAPASPLTALPAAGTRIAEPCETTVLVASVPLTEGLWRPLPEGQLAALVACRLLRSAQ